MKNVLIALLLLLSIGAIYGGGLMIVSPSGELLGVPISMLEPAPFDNFLIPGIILFTILGIIPLLTVYGLVKKVNNRYAEKLNIFADMHWSWSFTIYISFALIIWIQLQMVFVNAIHWAHTLYIFWALSILLFALLPNVRSKYRLSK